MAASFTLNNISENVVLANKASGSLVEITVRSNGKRMLHLYTSETLGLSQANATKWDFSPDNVASLNFGYDVAPVETTTGSGVFYPGITLGMTIAGEVRGTYYFTVTYIGENGGLSSLRVKVNIVASGTAQPSADGGDAAPDLAPWLDRSLIDVNFELRTRDITSSVLDAIKALKIGDQLVFAVLPTLGGTAIQADVTALILTVRAPNKFDEDDFLFQTVSGVTLVDAGGGNKYYKLELLLDSDELRDWFDALNAQNPPPEAGTLRKVVAMADVRITYSGRVFTSETFELPIEQPVTALS